MLQRTVYQGQGYRGRGADRTPQDADREHEGHTGSGGAPDGHAALLHTSPGGCRSCFVSPPCHTVLPGSQHSCIHSKGLRLSKTAAPLLSPRGSSKPETGTSCVPREVPTPVPCLAGLHSHPQPAVPLPPTPPQETSASGPTALCSSALARDPAPPSSERRGWRALRPVRPVRPGPAPPGRRGGAAEGGAAPGRARGQPAREARSALPRFSRASPSRLGGRSGCGLIGRRGRGPPHI